MADPDTLTIKGEPKHFKGKGDSGGDTKRYFCGTCGRLVTASFGDQDGSPRFPGEKWLMDQYSLHRHLCP
jgi:hypothetical protein